jgi:glucose/arabinose dehydrogenase
VVFALASLRRALGNGGAGARAFALATLLGCSSSSPPVTPDAAPAADGRAPDAPLAPDAAPPDAPAPADAGPDVPAADADPSTYCGQGSDVQGGAVPPGFCMRPFGEVPEARTLAFAPNGDLFVGSPSTPTAGGAGGGAGAIIVLADDDHDGVAESYTFADNLTDVHGLAFGPDALYFTTATEIWRTPYTAGQRKETGPRQGLGMPPKFSTGGRWAHGLAISPKGDIFASRGEYSTCGTSPGGEITKVGMGAPQVVASGFRNPMYMRCHRRDEVCAATELGEDQMTGAREKLIGLRPDTSYGYPCCYTRDSAVAVAPAGSCAAITAEDAMFVLSDTPFGLDWERELWPDPYKGALFVALHGSFYSNPSWAGARIVYARTDPTTHLPVEGWRDFASGFGPDGSPLERPSDVAFAPDGRMFFSDDHGGAVYWVAPLTLRRPN